MSAIIVSDGRCADSEMFANTLSFRATDPGTDPSIFLDKLEASTRRSQCTRVFGLTSSSNRFLIEQTLAPLGFVRTYGADHVYREEHLVHTLVGPMRPLRELASDLRTARRFWAGRVANAFERLTQIEAPSRSMTIKVPARRPTNSAGFLCSWLLERV